MPSPERRRSEIRATSGSVNVTRGEDERDGAIGGIALKCKGVWGL